MYSLGDYGSMIGDVVRMGPYVRAIEAAVRPGSVVLDLGCGPALFSLIACRAGARRVYAVDSAEIVQFGRQFATENHLTDRIEFFQSDSRQIQLPERADLIVFDLRGALPFFGHSLVSIEDARVRFLADGGIMIPQQDVLYAAIVEAETSYEKIASPWKDRINGLDLSSALSCVFNEIHPVHAGPEQLVTEPQAWWRIDYMKSPGASAAATLRFRTTRTAVAHGVLIWFDAQLYRDIGFSCAPGVPNNVYSNMLLPWPEPIAVSAGQEIQIALQAKLVGSDYVWRWDTQTSENQSGTFRHFKQSTLQGAQFSQYSLRKHAEDFIPSLSKEGEAERWLLQAMDGKSALEKIARDAAERFPHVFRRKEDAFLRASTLAERFSR